MIQETFLRIIVFAPPSFRRKPESRLNDFAWIPARAQLGWAALAGGNVDASVFQPPVTLRKRKAGLPIWVDHSKAEYQYVAGPVTTRSFIKTDRETVMNFMCAWRMVWTSTAMRKTRMLS